MNFYVYRTARGLLCTVSAVDPWEAWRLAAKKRKPVVLFSLDGEAWMESAKGNATRVRAADVPAGHARTLYFQACAAELSPAVREHLRVARLWTRADLSALRLRGLVGAGSLPPLTDLGAAFAAFVEGGAS